MTAAAQATDGLHIIDTDSHLPEPPDLWSSRAPAGWKEKLPRIEELSDGKHWVVGRDIDLGRVNASSVVGKAGNKSKGLEFFGWQHEHVHEACYDMKARLTVLDDFGIHAQVVYPNLAGFGNQKFVSLDDDELRLRCATIYNDAMAEIQQETGERVLPMALMPWWNIEHSVAEVRRAHELGLRGIVMCSDPDSIGLPDLGEDAWTPFWEACNDLEMPVNFHIGASETSFNMFGRAPWPSNGMSRRLALGSAYLFMENGRVIGNLLFSGVLEKFPHLKVVSVESGIGWIPFWLEALDYEWQETNAQAELPLSMKPSDYFKRQIYGCFWFEKIAPKHLIDAVGEDNVMFETDFPHPTCLYPHVQDYIAEVTVGWTSERKRKILQDNAAALYKVKLPS